MLIETKHSSVRGTVSHLRRTTERQFRALFASAFILFSFFGVFNYAQAFSFSDFFASFSADAKDTSEVTSFAVSKTALLRAAVNVDPNPAKGGGDITIVGGTALLPESGPEGTLADIQEQKPNSDQISIYVVRNGDSLSAIAKTFGVSVNTILWANDLTSAKSVRPGDTLVILPVSGVEHTVKKGETLAGIVKKYKGDMRDVLGINNLAPGAIVAVGDSILIPDGINAPAVVNVSGTKARIFGAGGPSIIGYYLRPLLGGRKSQGIHGYNGIDIATPIGTQVLASCPGTVLVSRDSGWNGGYGEYVVVQCSNNTQTLYGHLSGTSVPVGAEVVRGQVVGLSGNSGRSTGPHLHFEIRGARNPF